MTESSGRREPRGRSARLSTRNGRAVDRPAFWWSAAIVFVANAAVSAGESRWLVALLQILTAAWALVAGATAVDRRSYGRGGRTSGQADQPRAGGSDRAVAASGPSEARPTG